MPFLFLSLFSLSLPPSHDSFLPSQFFFSLSIATRNFSALGIDFFLQICTRPGIPSQHTPPPELGFGSGHPPSTIRCTLRLSGTYHQLPRANPYPTSLSVRLSRTNRLYFGFPSAFPVFFLPSISWTPIPNRLPLPNPISISGVPCKLFPSPFHPTNSSLAQRSYLEYSSPSFINQTAGFKRYSNRIKGSRLRERATLAFLWRAGRFLSSILYIAARFLCTTTHTHSLSLSVNGTDLGSALPCFSMEIKAIENWR